MKHSAVTVVITGRIAVAEQISPMVNMPTLQNELTFDLVAVIGLDRV